ncbi:hypothetical protein HBB16_05780 [Pseudonocardia sp. MCCB 268]|nr:hypothetical protein [Pseudonocardia cytotoxica]
MIFLVPAAPDTLRINGRARSSGRDYRRARGEGAPLLAQARWPSTRCLPLPWRSCAPSCGNARPGRKDRLAVDRRHREGACPARRAAGTDRVSTLACLTPTGSTGARRQGQCRLHRNRWSACEQWDHVSTLSCRCGGPCAPCCTPS